MSDFRTGMSGACMSVKFLRPGIAPTAVHVDSLDGGGFIKYVPERTCKNQETGQLSKELWFTCSNCEATTYLMSELDNPNIENGNFNYCPNCGAKVVE